MNKFKHFFTKTLGLSDTLFELFMYVVMGVMTTIINIVVFYLIEGVLQLNYIFANVVAWIFSVLFAYISNKKYVFAHEDNQETINVKEMMSFFSFRLLSLGIDTVVLFVLVKWLNQQPMIAKIISNVVVLIANYVFSKFIIFKKPSN
ncbi:MULTISPECIES: GtrA family protein [Vagococcus]|uniref:GtrA family protein n=1 Tax=Vagococcus TaxID=2737 RepID=UPI000E4E86EC|nr:MULTISPECIES: GtrA family protein [Vagococcus]RHH68698.1 GtrA family protein [Vagococcus sp. AM17-17]